jgi:hypothetical protein
VVGLVSGRALRIVHNSYINRLAALPPVGSSNQHLGGWMYLIPTLCNQKAIQDQNFGPMVA